MLGCHQALFTFIWCDVNLVRFDVVSVSSSVYSLLMPKRRRIEVFKLNMSLSKQLFHELMLRLICLRHEVKLVNQTQCNYDGCSIDFVGDIVTERFLTNNFKFPLWSRASPNRKALVDHVFVKDRLY